MPRRPRTLRPALVVLLAVLGLLAREASAQPTDAGRFAILFSNDDGYDAPGLQALIHAFAGYGDIYVAAPAQNQSGKGHSITIADAILVRRRSADGAAVAFAIEATPATSVRVGLEQLVPRRPDLVISGINRGENLGMAVYLSGTLGAAREAVFSRIPAIAVSMGGNAPADYAATAAFVRRLVDQLRAKGAVAPGLFLNVNAPAGEAKGVKLTRLSRLVGRQLFECSAPAKDRSACVSGYEPQTDAEPGTDMAEFARGFITLTPMTLDVTDASAVDSLRALEKLAAGAR